MNDIREPVPILSIIFLIIITIVLLAIVITENNIFLYCVFALYSWCITIVLALYNLTLKITINERTDYINMLYDSGMVK